MNYEQQLEALNALARCSLLMRRPGDWYVNQRVDVKNGPMLEGRYGNGTTPMEAVANHWKVLTELEGEQYLVCDAYDSEKRRGVRWNGFMWAEVKESSGSGSGEPR